MSGEVHALKGAQADAVNPGDSVWLSASAGTGKTQVLSARVLRLLLQEDCRPETLLCLTFTKAGAAEMATRVNDVLARWVRLDEVKLAGELSAIGAPTDRETLRRARTLFAQVLDCPGGGLRIDTIHAFSQYLLAAFPEEADLLPGTRAMEDRDRVLLSREVLTRVIADGTDAERDALADLSVRLGPDGAFGWLMQCAGAREAWFGPAGWQPPMRGRLLQLFGLPADIDETAIADLCSDERFDIASLRRCRQTLADWDTKTGREATEFIDGWLSSASADRYRTLDGFAGTLFTMTGTPKGLSNILKRDPDYAEPVERVRENLAAIEQQARLLALAEWLAPALALGRSFALAWEEAKTREGLIDFDDQIRRAAQLLSDKDMAGWIRYKLDRQFDHILVDEAQDTNAAQWSIIDALTEDFFTGIGQQGDKLRTIFVVGDYKQAIFRFQGTSPENFAIAKQAYATRIAEAAAAAREFARDNRSAPPLALRDLQDLDLDRSFRTTQPVLDFVDEAVDAIGWEQLGLKEPPSKHRGAPQAGYVELWRPVSAKEEDRQDEGEQADDSWLPGPERSMADRIAAQVRKWLDEGHPLAKGSERMAGPGDIMVLVRKRKELAGLIVARLHAAGVPVAGVDRLRLGAPLAVKDLVAALRFGVNPLDDLNLAHVLVSPLGGWTQDDLLHHGYRPRGVALWDHLRRSEDRLVVASVAKLRDLLARMDFEPPEALLHWMLAGPWNGRRKLVGRLGSEANDPIDELVNAAFAYSASHVASTAGFLQWFDAGEGEVKREAGGSGGLVRVMTVHGSKGLQAPIVILADATGNPHASRHSGLSLAADNTGDSRLPLPPIGKDDRLGPLAEEDERRKKEELEEHWRLLYVAMTRAEEALYVGGALGLREDEPNEDSWYARLAPLVDGTFYEDPIWGGTAGYGMMPEVEPQQVGAPNAGAGLIDVPEWATRLIGPEPRPPRPLAPSAAGDDRGADPPLPPEIAAQAARRGTVIHGLLERLPDVAREKRAEAGQRWLARQAADFDEEARGGMLQAALSVLDEAGFADLFTPRSLAEVPLTAIVGGQVISGTADRLLVTPGRVLVVDYKTARRPPERLEDISRSILSQMAAYVAVLEAIYPGRTVEAAVLFTQTPQLFVLPDAVLAPHKAALQGQQERFAGPGVDETQAPPR
ncbi:double-strand break repair helicase AddA [Altererythrobacter sp. MTPC7]|uniref:double-strand break repair helicase AddA n=1 Tax=Altererythrobacter sp. MTPC7 TaxID=3056567 RepID=UPI0036F25C0C